MNDIITKLVEGNKAAIAIATEEYLEIHRVCDSLVLPREAHGERLTASQRVALMRDLVLAYRRAQADRQQGKMGEIT